MSYFSLQNNLFPPSFPNFPPKSPYFFSQGRVQVKIFTVAYVSIAIIDQHKISDKIKYK